MLIDDRSGSISQADLMDLLRVARAWLDTPAGEMLLKAQQSVVEDSLQRCFGQHLVQYGLAPALLDGNQSALRNRWHFDLLAQPPTIPLEESQWPFAPQSLDVVLLHHGLDFCLSPRTLLREASQAVRAGGHIIILGFNPWLLSGDTLFAGGCGRLFEGTAEQMHASLQRLAALPDDTRVYCAHEYTQANLRFARAVEPDNQDIKVRAEVVDDLRAAGRITLPSSIGLEKKTNPFLRPAVADVISAAALRTGQSSATEVETFAAIRAWKDSF